MLLGCLQQAPSVLSRGFQETRREVPGGLPGRSKVAHSRASGDRVWLLYTRDSLLTTLLASPDLQTARDCQNAPRMRLGDSLEIPGCSQELLAFPGGFQARSLPGDSLQISRIFPGDAQGSTRSLPAQQVRSTLQPPRRLLALSWGSNPGGSQSRRLQGDSLEVLPGRSLEVPRRLPGHEVPMRVCGGFQDAPWKLPGKSQEIPRPRGSQPGSMRLSGDSKPKSLPWDSPEDSM